MAVACRFRLYSDEELSQWTRTIPQLLDDTLVFSNQDVDFVDFRFESFFALDDFLTREIPIDAELRAPELQPKLIWLGTYVGETFARCLDGRWAIARQKNSDNEGVLFVKHANGQITAPFVLVEDAIRRKPRLADRIPFSCPPLPNGTLSFPRPDSWRAIALWTPKSPPDDDEVGRHVRSACKLIPNAKVDKFGKSFVITAGDAYLRLAYEQGRQVGYECRLIGELMDRSFAGIRARYYLCGRDPKMELKDALAFITEQMCASGNFILFDPFKQKITFE